MSRKGEGHDVALIPSMITYALMAESMQDGGSTEPIRQVADELRLEEKNLVIFEVTSSLPGFTFGCICHASLLVYCRKLNLFVHHDSIQGHNRLFAEALYDAVWEFVVAGDDEKEKSLSKHQRKKKKNQRKKMKKDEKGLPSRRIVNTSIPKFVEAETPQQINACDCVVYIMAIARTICEWYVSDEDDHRKGETWFAAMWKTVTPATANTMRSEVMQIVHDLSVAGLQ